MRPRLRDVYLAAPDRDDPACIVDSLDAHNPGRETEALPRRREPPASRREFGMRMPRLPHDGHNAHQGPANGEAILDVEMFLARLVKLLVDGCVMHAVVRASGPQLTVRP